MYEMWLNPIPEEAAAEPVRSRESPDLQFAIDGRESPELPWEREYRARIRALEDDLSGVVFGGAAGAVPAAQRSA